MTLSNIVKVPDDLSSKVSRTFYLPCCRVAWIYNCKYNEKNDYIEHEK